MKGITGYLVAAVVLALVGVAFLTAGNLERDLASAQEDLATLKYGGAEATFDTAERYFEYASHLPWVGNAPLNEVRARKAALHYWQQQYAAVLPQETDPVGAVPPDNLDLQLVVANAVYRAGMTQAKDRQGTLQALDAGISAYLTVLKNTSHDPDAAYNYEYLIRLRDEIDKGRRKGPGELAMRGPQGAEGAPPTIESTLSDFKIYIPLESEERQDQGVAGKAAPMKRKG
jgi:hypothetical protein